jgi:hypothetical protein
MIRAEGWTGTVGTLESLAFPTYQFCAAGRTQITVGVYALLDRAGILKMVWAVFLGPYKVANGRIDDGLLGCAANCMILHTCLEYALDSGLILIAQSGFVYGTVHS